MKFSQTTFLNRLSIRRQSDPLNESGKMPQKAQHSSGPRARRKNRPEADFFSETSSEMSVELNSSLTSNESDVIYFYDNTPCPRKSVRFDMDSTIAIESSYVIEETDDLWYSIHDFRRFHLTTSLATRNILRTEDYMTREIWNGSPQFSEVLWDMYASLSRSNDDESRSECDERPLPQLGLMDRIINLWEPERVGLEGRLVDAIRGDARERREQLWQTAFESWPLNDPERLRRQCERISRPSRAYALNIAQAQSFDNETREQPEEITFPETDCEIAPITGCAARWWF